MALIGTIKSTTHIQSLYTNYSVNNNIILCPYRIVNLPLRLLCTVWVVMVSVFSSEYLVVLLPRYMLFTSYICVVD